MFVELIDLVRGGGDLELLALQEKEKAFKSTMEKETKDAQKAPAMPYQDPFAVSHLNPCLQQLRSDRTLPLPGCA